MKLIFLILVLGQIATLLIFISLTIQYFYFEHKEKKLNYGREKSGKSKKRNKRTWK